MSNGDSNIGMLLNVPVQSVMNLDVLMLDGNSTAADAIEKMKEKNARSVLVTHAGEAVGIVSKTDILFKVMGRGKDPTKVKLREIMSTPVVTISPSSTVGEALAIMDKHVVRQLIISAQTSIMGIITRDSIFEEIHKATLSTSATAISGTPVCIINPRAIAFIKDLSQAKLVCPYCSSPFDDKDALSKHIDRIHSGSDILEGDVRRMFE